MIQMAARPSPVYAELQQPAPPASSSSPAEGPRAAMIGSSTSSPVELPRVGGVRCYWALLTPHFPVTGNPNNLELRFVHPDPVLSSHLARQQGSLTGRDMLEFIHPSEVDQARKDLLEAMSIDDDNPGSVTRLRFTRLTRIKTLLGGTPEEMYYPPDASKYVEDDDYLVVDFSLNWCADNLILCFFHADRDKDPIANNDPERIHEGWSNFCGSSHLTDTHLHAIGEDLFDHVPIERVPPHPPRRVFQIFQAADDNPFRVEKPLWVWPPPRQPGDEFDAPDGLYETQDYSKEIEGLDLTPYLKKGKTTCQTRANLRFESRRENLFRMINVTVIPYGKIMFVRFQTVVQSPLEDVEPDQIMTSDSDPSSVPAEVWPETPQDVVLPASVIDPQTGTPVQTPPGPGPIDTSSVFSHIHIPPPRPDIDINDYRLPQIAGPSYDARQWRPIDNRLPIAPNPVYLNGPYPPIPYHQDPPPYMRHDPHQYQPVQHSRPATRTSPKQPEAGSSSRPMLQPPPGVDCCIWCHTRSSPEWRRSDSGIKNMCNACGLRRNRIKSKEMGLAKKGKKKSP